MKVGDLVKIKVSLTQDFVGKLGIITKIDHCNAEVLVLGTKKHAMHALYWLIKQGRTL